jgi:phytoene dehydrogenase-like protein
MHDADAIVIGSGMGGLTAGALLAVLKGWRVLVLERHWRAGGFTHTFSRPGGFEWDVGVHYVGEVGAPGLLHDVMRVTTGGGVAWRRLPELYDRLVFPGFEFGVRAGEEQFRADLRAAFPSEGEVIDRFLEDTLLAAAALGSTRRGARARARATTRAWLEEHVRDERLRAVLGARWLNHGAPPRHGAFLAHAAVVRHYLEGAYYPTGSARGIAEGAARVIEAAGGGVRVRAPVERILLESDGALGVRLTSGEDLRAPILISAVGARNTYLKLLAPDLPLPFREELERQPVGMAHATLYLGLARSPGALGVQGENLWLHDELDQDQVWERRGELLAGRPSHAYVSFPSMKDPSARGHTVEIMAAVDGAAFRRWERTRWMERGDDYRALKERIADGLLALAERRLPGLRGLVVHQEVSTPLSTERFTGHTGGEIYGLPATPARMELGWLGVRTPFPGLYLAGADAFFPGIAGAMTSGLRCAAEVVGHSLVDAVREAARSSPPTPPPSRSGGRGAARR